MRRKRFMSMAGIAAEPEQETELAPGERPGALQIIQEVAEEICDDYCIWNKACKTEEDLVEFCWQCPLNKLGL